MGFNSGFKGLIQLNLVSVRQFNPKVHALPIAITVIFLKFILHIKMRANERSSFSVHCCSTAVFYKGYTQILLPEEIFFF